MAKRTKQAPRKCQQVTAFGKKFQICQTVNRLTGREWFYLKPLFKLQKVR